MKLSEKAEEILEALWIATEEEGETALNLSSLQIATDDEALAELCQQAFVEVKGGRVHLRQEGRPEARMTVRRHRLAERLMMDVLDIKGDKGDDRDKRGMDLRESAAPVAMDSAARMPLWMAGPMPSPMSRVASPKESPISRALPSRAVGSP